MDDSQYPRNPVATAASNEQGPTDDDLGLSIDMLDADRLREWARLILVGGSDISHWGDRIFVASKMQTMATGIEHAVRDIGILRQRHSADLAGLLQKWREFAAECKLWGDSDYADGLKKCADELAAILSGGRR